MKKSEIKKGIRKAVQREFARFISEERYFENARLERGLLHSNVAMKFAPVGRALRKSVQPDEKAEE